MASQVYQQIKSAFQHLNPEQVRESAERPLNIGLMAVSAAGFAAMEDALMPPPVSRARRFELVRILHRIGEPGAENHFDLVLCDEELLCPPEAFPFRRANLRRTVQEILDNREDLGLALARNFLPFRQPLIARLIRTIAKENATFALLTALPDLFRKAVELPWDIAEFASDTAFVSMNQVRMTFLIAAASDREPGYYEQRVPIAAIVGGALGWRALARGLAEKIPFGGGLVPKAGIAYAGTYTTGVGLERFYRVGYGLTRQERERVYGQALERGRAVVNELLKTPRLPEAGG